MSPSIAFITSILSWAIGLFIGGLYVFFRNEDILNKYFSLMKQREDLSLFESVFNYSDNGLVILERDGKIRRANASFCEVIGYTEQELVGKRLSDITHHDDIREDSELIERMLSLDIKTYRHDIRYIHKNGYYVPASLRV